MVPVKVWRLLTVHVELSDRDDRRHAQNDDLKRKTRRERNPMKARGRKGVPQTTS